MFHLGMRIKVLLSSTLWCLISDERVVFVLCLFDASIAGDCVHRDKRLGKARLQLLHRFGIVLHCLGVLGNGGGSHAVRLLLDNDGLRR